MKPLRVHIDDIFGDRLAPDGSLVADNFSAWFGHSVIVDPQGAPLVAYHGTNRDFSTFRSYGLESVYYADGVEIRRADSWDMGDDRLGMPEAYHYMAITDAATLGPEEALRHRIEEARGSTHPDTLRLLADLRRLQGRAVQRRQEMRPSGDGFYFTTDIAYSFIRDIGTRSDGSIREGGNVMPVYLRLENPIWLNASQIESAGAAWQLQKYVAAGHDGAIFADHPRDLRQRGWNGSPQIVVFRPEQIKSAIGNSGMFDGTCPDLTDAQAWEAWSAQSRPARQARGQHATDLGARRALSMRGG